MSIPAIHRILVPTDLSDLGNLAVPHAYAVLRARGTVHLLHVIELRSLPNPLYAHYGPGRAPTPEERERQQAELLEHLRALIPRQAAARRITSRVHVVEARDVGDAIAEAATRLGVDLICLSSHGRSGISKALAGSVAQRVIHRTRLPVLLLRPPHRRTVRRTPRHGRDRR